MPGDAERFLRWNRDEIFKSLIAAEGHLRVFKPGLTPEDLTCVVKHLAEAESHADEAISHASQLGDDELARKFAELRDALKAFRTELQQRAPEPGEAIRRVRSLRGQFESFNPGYVVSTCKLCADIEEILKKLEGGVEVKQKTLISEQIEYKSGGSTVEWKEVGVVYGGLHIAKGITVGLKELDKYLGKQAEPVERRPSTWLVVGLSMGLPLAAYYLKLSEPWDMLMVLIGGYISTALWDIIEEAGMTAQAKL
jgi:hypothetical protein